MQPSISVEERLSRMERGLRRSRVFAAVATGCAVALAGVALMVAQGRQPRYDNVIIDEDSIRIRNGDDERLLLMAGTMRFWSPLKSTEIFTGRIEMHNVQHTYDGAYLVLTPYDLSMKYSPKGIGREAPSAWLNLGVTDGVVRADMEGRDTADVSVDDGKHRAQLLPHGVDVRPSVNGPYLSDPKIH